MAAAKDAPPQCLLDTSTNEISNDNQRMTAKQTESVDNDLSYFGTKALDPYHNAQNALRRGEFNEALRIIEGLLEDLCGRLQRVIFPANDEATSGTNGNDSNGNSVDWKNSQSTLDSQQEKVELHEALAPLYYLYGTTLLYLVEESSDVMMTQKTAENHNQSEKNEDQCEIESKNGTSFIQNRNGDHEELQERETIHEEQTSKLLTDEEEEEQEQETPSSDPTEDLQIAWENLETARNIFYRMNVVKEYVSNDDSESNTLQRGVLNSPPNHQQKEILLDLAKVHTRLGDLQRANTNTLGSIKDYKRSLDIRLICFKDDDTFDPLVAEAHFSLAQAYLETPNQERTKEENARDIVAKLGGADSDDHVIDGDVSRVMSKEEISSFHEKACDHYLACGVAFAGILAKMCGVDAREISSTALVDLGSLNIPTISALLNRGDPSGSKTLHSQALFIIRQRVSTLEPLPEVDRNLFLEKKEMLDEIQEALDSAKESEEALKEVAQMKADEIRKHAMGDGDDLNGVDEERKGAVLEVGGAVTTIGFGTSSEIKALAEKTVSLEENVVAAAPTVMVVKKKEKKKLHQESCAGDELTKRAKTS